MTYLCHYHLTPYGGAEFNNTINLIDKTTHLLLSDSHWSDQPSVNIIYNGRKGSEPTITKLCMFLARTCNCLLGSGELPVFTFVPRSKPSSELTNIHAYMQTKRCLVRCRCCHLLCKGRYSNRTSRSKSSQVQYMCPRGQVAGQGRRHCHWFCRARCNNQMRRSMSIPNHCMLCPG